MLVTHTIDTFLHIIFIHISFDYCYWYYFAITILLLPSYFIIIIFDTPFYFLDIVIADIIITPLLLRFRVSPLLATLRHYYVFLLLSLRCRHCFARHYYVINTIIGHYAFFADCHWAITLADSWWYASFLMPLLILLDYYIILMPLMSFHILHRLLRLALFLLPLILFLRHDFLHFITPLLHYTHFHFHYFSFNTGYCPWYAAILRHFFSLIIYYADTDADYFS